MDPTVFAKFKSFLTKVLYTKPSNYSLANDVVGTNGFFHLCYLYFMSYVELSINSLSQIVTHTHRLWHLWIKDVETPDLCPLPIIRFVERS